MIHPGLCISAVCGVEDRGHLHLARDSFLPGPTARPKLAVAITAANSNEFGELDPFLFWS